LESNI